MLIWLYLFSMMQETFGMVKPEGIPYSEDIEARILAAGLHIKEKRQAFLTFEQFEMIYPNAKVRTPNIYESLRDYTTSNPVLLLHIEGENAIDVLLELRGSSNAADAKPESIRGTYANNQDYKPLYVQGKFAMNVFHAADMHEVESALGMFFGK